jgi:hypothetical protein
MNPAGEAMSETGEWDDMTQQQRDEILNGARLAAVLRDAERAELRGRLARASAPSPRALDAMRHTV